VRADLFISEAHICSSSQPELQTETCRYLLMDTPSKTDQRVTFRPSFLVIWASILLRAIVLGCPILFVILSLKGIAPAKTLGPFLRGITAALVVTGPLASILCFCFPQSITSRGIDAHSFWGVRRFISWNDIAIIRPFSWVGLKFLRLDSGSDDKTAWLCRFPMRKSKFKQTLLQLAPPDHPIRTYFS